MGAFIDLTGQQFGRLLVKNRAPNDKGGHAQWLCECECGKAVVAKAGNMKSGNTLSCGCLRVEISTAFNTSHGHGGHNGRGKSKTYYTWTNMKQRCTNPKVERYSSYGGRGIKVCDRWLKSFDAFLADMGEAPPGMSIDRIDVNGNYEPGNCRWATDVMQRANKRPTKKKAASSDTAVAA